MMLDKNDVMRRRPKLTKPGLVFEPWTAANHGAAVDGERPSVWMRSVSSPGPAKYQEVTKT
jgi:hypothetical protein